MTLRRAILFGGGIVAGLLATTTPQQAHKAITSKYTYTEDVYPIVAQHCAGCHAPGGIAPMSLLTYNDAIPWGESIRAELVAGHMPPWFADTGYSDLRDPHRLTPRELDILMTWATGGNPQGPAKKLPAPALKGGWRLGKPDLLIQAPADVTLPADKTDDTQDVVLQESNDKDQWIRAADLLPGTPAMVHDATIYVKDAAGKQTVVALWVPSFAPVQPMARVGFKWPAGSALAARIHYHKTWKYEGKPLTDRSTVGLYFLKTAADAEVESVKLTPSLVVDRDLQAVAIRPDGPPSDLNVRVEAVKPDGAKIPLISLLTRANWDQRYWFERPISLPKGTRIQIDVTPTQDAKSQAADQAVPLWLDIVSNQVTESTR